jgi:hypothetical protein
MGENEVLNVMTSGCEIDIDFTRHLLKILLCHRSQIFHLFNLDDLLFHLAIQDKVIKMFLSFEDQCDTAFNKVFINCEGVIINLF